MRLTLGVRRILAVVATAAVFPAFAIASRALAPGGEAALRQRPRVLKLQPLMDRLGLRPAGSIPAELRLGGKVRVTVVHPRTLASFGIRGARVGDVAWITATLPQAQPGDRAAAEAQGKQAEAAAKGTAAAGDLDAAVSVETTDANGHKKQQVTTVPAGPGPGLPTTRD